MGNSKDFFLKSERDFLRVIYPSYRMRGRGHRRCSPRRWGVAISKPRAYILKRCRFYEPDCVCVSMTEFETSWEAVYVCDCV